MSDVLPPTTPAMSRVHADMLVTEIKKAGTRAEVRQIAARHAHWLGKKDRDRLRPIVAARLAALPGADDDA